MQSPARFRFLLILVSFATSVFSLSCPTLDSLLLLAAFLVDLFVSAGSGFGSSSAVCSSAPSGCSSTLSGLSSTFSWQASFAISSTVFRVFSSFASVAATEAASSFLVSVLACLAPLSTGLLFFDSVVIFFLETDRFSWGSLEWLNSLWLDSAMVLWFSLMVVCLSTEPMILALLSLLRVASIRSWNITSFLWMSLSLLEDLLEGCFWTLWPSIGARLVFSLNPISSAPSRSLPLEPLFLARRAGSVRFFMEDLASPLGVNSAFFSDISLLANLKYYI